VHGQTNSRTGLGSWGDLSSPFGVDAGLSGYPEQARQRAAEAQQRAQEPARSYSLTFARYRAGTARPLLPRAQTALELAEVVLSVATTHGYMSQLVEGLRLLEEALVQVDISGNYHRVFLGVARQRRQR
jgi:hypothetical protein